MFGFALRIASRTSSPSAERVRREVEVDEGDVEGVGPKELPGRPGGQRGDDHPVEGLEVGLDERDHGLVVVDDEEAGRPETGGVRATLGGRRGFQAG